MPEGDSIYRLAEELRAVLVGREVIAFESHAIADDVARTVIGQKVVAVDARGKNLLVRFDDGRALHVHLRMLGRLQVERPRSAFYRPRRTTPQLRLAVAGAAIVGRRIPVLRLLRPGAEARAPELAGLGPDLLALREEGDVVEAVRRLRGLGALPIGQALLVQQALAGIGNVYKSEVLFLEKIDPRTPVRALDDAALERLVRRAAELLRQNVSPRAGARTFARQTRPALAGPRVWVYGRRGRPCLRCAAPIEVTRQGAPPGRPTYHCPRCQAASNEVSRDEPPR